MCWGSVAASPPPSPLPSGPVAPVSKAILKSQFPGFSNLKVEDSLLSDEDESEAEDDGAGRDWKSYFHSILCLHVTEHLSEND